MKAQTLALFAVCFGVAFSQTVVIKGNQSGDCSADNSNCDWVVGVWNVEYRGNSYSCSGEAPLSQPMSPNDVCCTRGYTLPGYCVYGYREEDGLLISNCIYLESRIVIQSPGDAEGVRSLRTATSFIVNNFDNGITYSMTSGGPSQCTPFRQLTTDSILSNGYFPNVVANAQPSCPQFPVGSLLCTPSSGTEGDGRVSSSQTARRRIPASRDKGYTIFKYYNTAGNCSLYNSGCDWLVGAWDGLIASQGYSKAYFNGESPLLLPRSPEDILCAPQPFFLPFACDFGYSTFTGELLAYCVIGSTRIGIPGLTFSIPVDQNDTISSLHNGFRSADGSCTPMDRIDTDVIVFNVAPIFPEIDCSVNNTSPDTNVRCVEGVEHVAYGILIRGYGDGTTTGVPGGGTGYSSASSFSASLLLVLLCAVYFLF
jgi:hypothetical protein